MISFDYQIPTKIIFGRGRLRELGDLALPGASALIVTSAGGSARKNGYLAAVEAQLDRAGVAHTLFEGVQPNPTKDNVMDGAALARRDGCDFVIGLGGGSSTDAAKAIAIMAVNDGDYWDYILAGSGKGMPIPNRPLPIVTISTTSGTGTEADPWTVVSNEAIQEKIGFGYDATFPALSIIDPELTRTVPPHLTAYQGFDVLFHCAEGYISKSHYPVSDIYCLKAIELVGKSLARAVADGDDMDAREDMALANMLAGFAESTSSCISQHSMEHALSALHPALAHGAGLILLSRAYFTFHTRSGACDRRMVDMAAALGKKDATKPMEFVDALLELQTACNVADLKMSDFGVTRGEIPALAKNARETMGGLFEGDPTPIDMAACISIYEDAYR
jgi:alcohol dehydrogenase